jgi:DNA (cytosine-5)-methyltransferase 3A
VSLFNGASVAGLALERAGFNIVETYTSEIDKYAILHEKKRYPNNIQFGDIRQIDFVELKLKIKEQYQCKAVILMGGSPCQNLSFAGNRKGMVTSCNVRVTSLEQYLRLKEDGFKFQGQSYLFWEFMRAKEELQPDFFLLENVAMSKKNKAVFDEAIGINGVLFDSSLVSAQERRRYYWFNWDTPKIKDRGIELNDVLDYTQPFRNLGKWVYGNFGNRRKLDRLRTVYNKKAFTLTTSRTHSSQYYLNRERDMYRNLTVEEWEKLQTFPTGWTDVNGISNTQKHKLIGNSWTLEIIVEIVKSLKKINT